MREYHNNLWEGLGTTGAYVRYLSLRWFYEADILLPHRLYSTARTYLVVLITFIRGCLLEKDWRLAYTALGSFLSNMNVVTKLVAQDPLSLPIRAGSKVRFLSH